MKPAQSKTTLKLSVSAILLGSLLPLLLAQPVLADTPVNVKDITKCRVIDGKAERLLCYDTIADGGVFNEQQLQQVRVENFGSKKKASNLSVDELTVSITRIQKDVNGLRYFQTSDGQVWKQQNMGSWSSKVPFDAEIKAGTLGSFFLKEKGGKRSIKVKRIK
jgi:hypothetical protein